jgi:DNA-binding MarR family transcriptional regulator
MLFKKDKIIKQVKTIFVRSNLKDFGKGYNKIPVEVEQIKQSISLSAAQKLVFEKLVLYCFVLKDANGYTTVSNRKLAEDLGLGASYINKTIHKLKGKNIINFEIIEPWDERNQSKTNNRYRLITIVGGEKHIIHQKIK